MQSMSSRDFDDVRARPHVDYGDDDDVYDNWSDCPSNNNSCCCCWRRDKATSPQTDCVLDIDLHGVTRLRRPSSPLPSLRRSVHDRGTSPRGGLAGRVHATFAGDCSYDWCKSDRNFFPPGRRRRSRLEPCLASLQNAGMRRICCFCSASKSWKVFSLGVRGALPLMLDQRLFHGNVKRGNHLRKPPWLNHLQTAFFNSAQLTKLAILGDEVTKTEALRHIF